MASSTYERPIRFLHIPKTAGTSLNVLLDRFHTASSIFVFKHTDTLSESLEKLRSLDPERRRGIRLYRGHAPLVTGDKEVDEARTFTLLRDPVQRVRSFCDYVHDGKHNRLSAQFTPENFDLHKLLDEDDPQLENQQTRMLLGETAYLALRESFRMEDLREQVSAAFARMEFIGLQEHYEESVLLATLIFGWPPISPRKKLNVRDDKKPLQFHEEHLRRITAMNTMDIEAYRMAGEIYEQTRARHKNGIAWLRLRLRLQNTLNSLKARILPARAAS